MSEAVAPDRETKRMSWRVKAVGYALQPELVFRQSKVLSPFERQIYRELDTEWQENFVDFKNRARPVLTEYARSAAEGSGAVLRSDRRFGWHRGRHLH